MISTSAIENNCDHIHWVMNVKNFPLQSIAEKKFVKYVKKKVIISTYLKDDCRILALTEINRNKIDVQTRNCLTTWVYSWTVARNNDTELNGGGFVAAAFGNKLIKVGHVLRLAPMGAQPLITKRYHGFKYGILDQVTRQDCVINMCSSLVHVLFTRSVLRNKSQELVQKVQTSFNSWD